MTGVGDLPRNMSTALRHELHERSAEIKRCIVCVSENEVPTVFTICQDDADVLAVAGGTRSTSGWLTLYDVGIMPVIVVFRRRACEARNPTDHLVLGYLI